MRFSRLCTSLLILLLAVSWLASCATSSNTDVAIADSAKAGVWTGKMRCSKKGLFVVQLALWETAPDKFYGQTTLTSADGNQAPIVYPVRGYRHSSGSIIIEPDHKNPPEPFYYAKNLVISLSGRLDPISRKLIGSISRGCRGRLSLNAAPSKAVDLLASKYGQHDRKTAAKLEKEAKVAKAQALCAKTAGSRQYPPARYQDQSNPLKAPAFKQGLFVYQHRCLTNTLKQAQLIYSRTAPEAPGDFIEVKFGVFDKGTKVSRRDVSIVQLAQVCKVFDYSVIGGKRYFCTPYGWRYTDRVRKQCLSPTDNPLKALGCQMAVMGQSIEAFERGSRQVPRH